MNQVALTSDRGRTTLVASLLFLLAAAVFFPSLSNGFVNFDDGVYVYENPRVLSGLNWSGIAWIFTHADCNFYHPLTMLSLMVDHQIHGLNPRGYHLTNILLHASSAVLLFRALRQATGTLWRSAFVAAVFAVHPLRVESVAWIAERKDVLSVFFFMLVLAAYVRYAQAGFSRARYFAVLVLFLLGLLCKSSLVTLPFLLLVLDYWPLQRDKGISWRGLAAEKTPLFALAIAAAVLSFFVQGEAVQSVEIFPFALRLPNAVLSYVTYIGQMFFPAGLSPYYPISYIALKPWRIALCLFLLLAITMAVLLLRRSRPYLLTGWLWYCGMLFPMSGIVLVGSYAHADRFTYLPQIGLLIMISWGISDLTAGWKFQKAALPSASAAILLLLSALTIRQTAYWKNGETLFRWALAVTPRNGVAHLFLGTAILDKPGGLREAIAHFREALKIWPQSLDARIYLGIALAKDERPAEAIPEFRKAIELDPHNARARNGLASALYMTGRLTESIREYREALKWNPDDEETRKNLETILEMQAEGQLPAGGF